MARQEHVRRGPQVEPEFVDRIRFEEFGRRERVAVTCAQNALGQDHRPAIRVHIHQLARKVRVTRR